MISSRQRRYRNVLHAQEADDAFAKTELGNADPQITVSVSATDERRAVQAASVLIKILKLEFFADQFEKAMDSGDYTTGNG